jgi:hypothetical protein
MPRTSLLARGWIFLASAAVATLGCAPALATPSSESGVVRFSFPEDYHDSMPAGDLCGFSANIYEDRTGSFDVTLHTKGNLAGVAHIVGHIAGTRFIVTPTDPLDIRSWTGTYKEINNVTVSAFNTPDETVYKTESFHLTGHAAGSDGSTLRLKLRENLTINTRTGAVQHDKAVNECVVTAH